MSPTRSSCHKRTSKVAPLDEKQKSKRSRSSKNKVAKNAREEETNDKLATTLANHIAVAAPFIVHLFSSKRGESHFEEIWDSLVGTAWQEDVDVCCSALACGLSVDKLAGLNILRNVDFLSNAFPSAKNKQQAVTLWGLIGTDLQQNHRVAFAALNRGAVAFSKVTKSIKDNKKCLLVGLQQGEFKWKALPKRYKQDVDFALSACGQDKTVFEKACLVVTDKEKLWRQWACRNPKSICFRTAPDSIVSDPILMQEMISRQPSVARYLHSSLAEEGDFVQKVLKGNLEVLPFFPRRTYSHFPSIVNVETVAKYGATGNMYHLQPVVPAQHWTDRSFVLGWVSAGGPIHEDIAEPLLDDEEVVLMFAKNRPSGTPSRLSLISERLRTDNKIIRQLLEAVRPASVFDVLLPKALRKDHTLHIFACAKHQYYAPFWDSELFLAKMKSSLKEYEGFFKGILCGCTPGSGSPLVLLNTGSDILRIVASFVDFPVGEDLGFLFQAAIHRRVDGFNPYRWKKNSAVAKAEDDDKAQ